MTEKKLAAPTIGQAAARTGLQATPTTLILSGLDVFNVWHPTGEQAAWLVAVGTIVFSWLHNLAERRGWMKPVLRG